MRTCTKWSASGPQDAVTANLKALSEVKVMQNKQVTRGGGDEHLAAVWRQAHPHQIARVKELLMRTAVFCEPAHIHPSQIPLNKSMYTIDVMTSNSTNLLVSQVITFPSKPDVTSKRVCVSYSIFFTQLAWPCNEHTFEFSFLKSHNAMVVSSEQVANNRLSRNLQDTQRINL